MSQLVAPIFSRGENGSLVVSSNTTHSRASAGCSGSSGSKSLSLDNASTFEDGMKVVIIQFRGGSISDPNWEENYIVSGGGSTTLNLLYNLSRNYTDSGADQAFIVEVKRYRSIKVNSGVNLSVPVWDGNKDGLLFVDCAGITEIAGEILGNAAGYLGGPNNELLSGSGQTGKRGEGTAGDNETRQNGANGNGGGGGNFTGGTADAGGGGGGANGTAGGNGGAGTANGTAGGVGGGIVGNNTLTTLLPGGGGAQGGVWDNSNSNGGGKGGGIIVLNTRILKITGSGAIRSNGSNGINANTNGQGGGGGGGGGGSILIRCEIAEIGTDRIETLGGNGGSAAGTNGAGGNGGKGRIRIEAGKVTGSIASSLAGSISIVKGGHKWLGEVGFIG